MPSIRMQLTSAYAGALIGTMVAFAAVLWGARRASGYRDLEVEVANRADQALAIIERAVESSEPVTVVSDTLIGPVVTPRLKASLEGVPDYVLVLDERGRTLYSSFAHRQLDAEDRFLLDSAAIRLTTAGGAAALVTLSRQQLLVVARAERDPVTAIAKVVAGVSTSYARLAPRELVGTMLVIAPFVLLLSVGGAYFIAGRALRPVEQIINEVEAITDGRSLHRRLPVDEGGDELARLNETLNAMMSRLENSFGALRRFTADASHELKTPLAVLRADVERAMHAHTTPGEQLVALEEALQETTRIADLVESLLTLARADEGRFDLHREPVPLLPLARDVYETALILGEDAGLTVTMPLAEDATVLGDRTRLRQLFLNLVTNAIKYTPRGGRVELLLSRRLDAVTFSVRDTGIGISAADLPYVFERFWRADRVRSRRVPSGDGASIVERGGFGLGLAISQYIAQAHGGTLTAQSRLGRGSTFTATLPLAEPAQAATVDSADGREPRGDGRPDRSDDLSRAAS
ncbi:MAG TPA: HAMP domain-containing sensor histidine kinase [Gemmatimonadaceae bacterium]|nr:HAMP domain-containing sensor histidine kinase [Gemmatimonadaceae bacterium]